MEWIDQVVKGRRRRGGEAIEEATCSAKEMCTVLINNQDPKSGSKAPRGPCAFKSRLSARTRQLAAQEYVPITTQCVLYYYYCTLIPVSSYVILSTILY